METQSLSVQTAQRIMDAVNEHWDEQVAFLQELVRTPSVTGQEAACQAVVAAQLRGAGLETEVWEPDAAELAPYADQVGTFPDFRVRPNVAGRLAGRGGGRSLILNAHVDTVDPGDPARWTHRPFAAEIVDGRLYGRGACDMKGGISANIFALAAVRAAGMTLAGDVIIETTVSEEDGGAGALAAILRGYKADAAIIPEPTDLEVVAAQGGSLVFRLHVEGRAAHACVRDEGVSAIEKFAVLHQALLAFERRRNATLDHPLYRDIPNKIPINIGTIQGGNWPSSVPESLIAEGRAGLVPGEDMETFRRELVQAVADAAADDPWLARHPPRIEWFSGQFAPAEIAGDAPLVQTVIAAHETVNRAKPKVTGVTYGADMRHFLLAGHMPCLMYGAGDVRLAHFTDESLPLADLKRATKTLALTVAAWCGLTE